MKELKVVVKDNGELGRVIENRSDKVKYFYPVGYGRYTLDELETLNEINYREASFDEKIEYIKANFTHGKVLNVHIIGIYQIVEFEALSGKVLFQSFFRFNDKYTCYESLDKAITGVIFERYEGSDSTLNSYVWNILDNIQV